MPGWLHSNPQMRKAVTQFVPSEKLLAQIKGMVERHEDWIPEADGIDADIHIVVNDFDYGVWLCEHKGECNMAKFVRLQKLA